MPELGEEIEQRQIMLRRLLRQRPQNAFRPSRRAGRIEHGGAEPLIRDRCCRHIRGDVRKSDDALALAGAVGDDAELDVGAGLDRLAGDVELRHRGDQDLGLAVDQQIGELARRQERVDAGVVQPGAFAGAAGLQIARIVLHEDRVVVEPLQAVLAEQVGQPVAARIELAIGDGLACGRHDEGGLQRA
ncbi:hypothetical protein ABH974_000687 [Bradyrhizobium ottawaense]